jgi:hypothetical protein
MTLLQAETFEQMANDVRLFERVHAVTDQILADQMRQQVVPRPEPMPLALEPPRAA